MRYIQKSKKKYAWVEYPKNRVKRNKNFLVFISGPTGSGKSWASLSYAELIDPNFSIDRVVFRADELMELINSDKLKPGSVIVFEEAGIEMDSAKWQSIINKAMKYLFETFRHRRFIMIMNAPLLNFMAKSQRSLMHAVVQTQRIDIKKKTTVVKPMLLQYNERYDKVYWKYLKVRLPGGGTAPVKRWAIPKASDSLIKDYEKKKRAFTDALNQEILMDIKKAKESKQPKEKNKYNCGACGHEWESKSKTKTRCPACYEPPIRKRPISNTQFFKTDNMPKKPKSKAKKHLDLIKSSLST